MAYVLFIFILQRISFRCLLSLSLARSLARSLDRHSVCQVYRLKPIDLHISLNISIEQREGDDTFVDADRRQCAICEHTDRLVDESY